jgi:hypothetical protein
MAAATLRWLALVLFLCGLGGWALFGFNVKVRERDRERDRVQPRRCDVGMRCGDAVASGEIQRDRGLRHRSPPADPDCALLFVS